MEGTGCEDGSCERGGLEGGEGRVEGGERGATGGVLGAGDKACANTVGGNGRGEGDFSGNSDGVLLRFCGCDHQVQDHRQFFHASSRRACHGYTLSRGMSHRLLCICVRTVDQILRSSLRGTASTTKGQYPVMGLVIFDIRDWVTAPRCFLWR